MNQAKDNEYLSDEEIEQLVSQARAYNPDVNDEEITEIIRWAAGVKMDTVALGLVMKGYTCPEFKDGQINFRVLDEVAARLRSSGILEPLISDMVM